MQSASQTEKTGFNTYKCVMKDSSFDRPASAFTFYLLRNALGEWLKSNLFP